MSLISTTFALVRLEEDEELARLMNELQEEELPYELEPEYEVWCQKQIEIAKA